MYPGYLLSTHSGAIVITFNYRVSTLGWLSTGDENLPGNYGLWDAQAALAWIRDHIESFGGDPNSITAIGQSAGAAIVSHLMISGKTNKLIKNAFCMSGSSTGYFGLSRQPLRLASLLGQIFGCSLESTGAIESCLRKVDAELLDFWGALAQMTFESRNPTLLPVIDGDFVTKEPRESFLEGVGKHLNFISGYVNDDAASFIFKQPIGLPGLGKNSSVVSNESLWQHMRQWYGFLENVEKILENIVNKYPDMNTTDKMTRGKSSSQAFTEAWFSSSSNWESTTHGSFGKGKAYQYILRHRQTFIPTYEGWVNGTHTDDLYSVFGPPFLKIYRKLIFRKDFTEPDLALNQHLMSYIANFAQTGNPNEGHHSVPVKWPVHENDTQRYLELSPSPKVQNFRSSDILERFKFHNDLPSEYVYPRQPPIPPKVRETDIQRAAEKMRKILLSLADHSIYKRGVDEMISNFTRRRLTFLNGKRLQEKKK